VTDANVILGYLDPNYFLGGAMPLDVEAARRAIATRLAQPLKLSVTDAARGVFEVVNQNMLSAIKVHIAERGEDPQKFYLFAFGGAGPAHAYELARALRMKGVVVPPGAGATSAMGLVTTAASFDFARSFVTRLDRVPWRELRAVFDAMEQEGRQMLREAGVDPKDPGVHLVRSMDLRHKGQGYELTVEIPDALFQRGSVAELTTHFYERYTDKYGHAHTNLPVELITCRTSIAGPPPVVPAQPLEQAPGGDGAHAAVKGTRPVYFPERGDFAPAPVYDRYRLPARSAFEGPAVIEERECTIIAGPSSRVRVDTAGNLFIDLAPASPATAGDAGEVAATAARGAR
jgi:N-methylhydantoinase A